MNASRTASGLEGKIRRSNWQPSSICRKHFGWVKKRWWKLFILDAILQTRIKISDLISFLTDVWIKVFVTFRKKRLTLWGAIGLSWKTVYTQNLCRNYFKTETSKNKIWNKLPKCGLTYSEKLDELFSTDIPVLLTSQLLLDVLLKKKNVQISTTR